jgi:hypothetical protein
MPHALGGKRRQRLQTVFSTWFPPYSKAAVGRLTTSDDQFGDRVADIPVIGRLRHHAVAGEGSGRHDDTQKR